MNTQEAITQDFEIAQKLQKSNRVEEAYAVYSKIIKNNPKNFQAYHQLGLMLFRTGNLKDAVKVIQKSLQLEPMHIHSINNLGVIYKKLGLLAKSEAIYKECIKKAPKYIEVYNNLGNLYRENGFINDAIKVYQSAILINPKHIQSRINLGLIYHKQKNYQKALDVFNEAMKISPKSPLPYFHIGNMLYDLKSYDRAVEYLKKAIVLNPKNPDYYNNLGVMLKSMKRYGDAVTIYNEALKLNSRHANTYNNLSLALKELRRFDLALKSIATSIKLAPNEANAFNNLGTIYEDTLHFDKALSAFNKALSIDKNHKNANWNLAVLQLKLGDYENGFKNYEWRWLNAAAKPKPKLQKSEYKGENLKDKTILVYTEQGFGDAIHFVRYLPMLSSKGAKVIVHCKKEIASLIKNLNSVDKVITSFDELKMDYDYHVPMMSLAYHMGTTLSSIPNEVPYLFNRGRGISFKLDKKKLNIGICWSASPTGAQYDEKVIDLKLFEPLLRVKNTQFYSLQVGHDSDMLQKYELEDKIINLAPKLQDFSKTASAISKLDMIIGSDTSVLHLAGALGVKGYIMIPYYNDWRWMLKREDCVWYPTLELFRQEKYGDWSRVMDTVKQSIIDNFDTLKNIKERKNSRRKK